jgi:isoleucyl-tRNA synthetase
LPGSRTASVFLTQWYTELPEPETEGQLNSDFWMELMLVRQQVNKALELSREQGVVRGSLDAAVWLYAGSDLAARLNHLGDELRFALITSEAAVLDWEDAPAEAMEAEGIPLRIVVQSASGEKCERCWHRRADVGQYEQHPTLCGRCVTNIEGPGEVRHFA